MNCEDCKWWRRTEEEITTPGGWCFRMPHTEPKEELEWCSEFEAKKISNVLPEDKKASNIVDVQNAKLYCDGEEICVVRYIEIDVRDIYTIHTTGRFKQFTIINLHTGSHKWEVRSDGPFGPDVIEWNGCINKSYSNKICMTPMGAPPIPDLEVYTLEITIEDEDTINRFGLPIVITVEQIKKMICDDIQRGGTIREAIKNM